MTRRGVKRPAVRVRWELEEYTPGKGHSVLLEMLAGLLLKLPEAVKKLRRTASLIASWRSDVLPVLSLLF